MNTMLIEINKPIDFSSFYLSRHLIEDHPERYMEIQLGCGFGDHFVSVVEMETKYECLTNTGVVMIVAKEVESNGKRKLITTYIGTVDKGSAMFRTGGHSLPSVVASAILHAGTTKKNKNKRRKK